MPFIFQCPKCYFELIGSSKKSFPTCSKCHIQYDVPEDAYEISETEAEYASLKISIMEMRGVNDTFYYWKEPHWYSDPANAYKINKEEIYRILGWETISNKDFKELPILALPIIAFRNFER